MKLNYSIMKSTIWNDEFGLNIILLFGEYFI